MGKLKLAVAGAAPYAGRLAECIRKNAPEYLEVASCLQAVQLPVFLEMLSPDILLYDKGAALPKQLPQHTVKILLADSKGCGDETGPFIFRYQQGPEILRQAFQIYEKESNKNLVCWCKTADLAMTAVYAPGGHELQLPFSLAYASLCGEEKKVLYLNLAEFTGMGQLFAEEEGENFSDLVYGIRHRKAKFQLCLQSVLHHAETFDYVQPPGSPQDLYEAQEEDVAVLLTLLREQTEYELVVWNCGTWNQAVAQVMEHSSSIICLTKENMFGKYRKAEFDQFLEKGKWKKLQEKIKCISLQAGLGGLIQEADLFAQLRNGEFGEQVKLAVG